MPWRDTQPHGILIILFVVVKTEITIIIIVISRDISHTVDGRPSQTNQSLYYRKQTTDVHTYIF